MAERTGGFHLNLNQFSHVTDLIMAVAYKQEGDERLQKFEQELVGSGRMNRQVDEMIGTMLGRSGSNRFKATIGELGAVKGGRFQVMEVDKDQDIKSFVQGQGAAFKKGRGCQEFPKRVTIQDYKEVILQDRKTGDLFSGDKARMLARIPIGRTASVNPTDCPGYRVFVQSTSVDRKLLAGTKFLYEVDDWEEPAFATI